MSLNFDVRNIPNYETHFPKIPDGEGQQFSGITQSLCFFLMFVGVGEITQKNWKDVYRRVNAWQKMVGNTHYYHDDQTDSLEPIVHTASDVFFHIGFRVNVIPEPPTKFYRRLFEVSCESSNTDIRIFERELEDKKAKNLEVLTND